MIRLFWGGLLVFGGCAPEAATWSEGSELRFPSAPVHLFEPLTDEFQISESGTEHQDHPRLAISDDLQWRAVWNEYEVNGTRRSLPTRLFDRDAPIAEQILQSVPSDPHHPSIPQPSRRVATSSSSHRASGPPTAALPL